MDNHKALERVSLWDADEKESQGVIIYFEGIWYDTFVYSSTGIKIILN